MLPTALLLIAACGPPIYECTDPLEPHRPPTDSAVLHQEGQLLVDAEGQVVRLTGVNLGGWLMWEGWLWGAPLDAWHLGRHGETPMLARLTELYGGAAAASFREAVDQRFVTAADLDAIADLGFNVLRLPLNHRVVDDPVRLLVVDDLMDSAHAAGLWVVLDLHGAPGGQSDLFTADPDDVLLWHDPSAQAATVAAWATLAERYGDHPALAGYDLLNEPMPDQDQVYLDLLDDIIAALRIYDSEHLVFVEGTDFARDFRLFETRLDDNMVYEAHVYTSLDLRAQARVAGFRELATCHDVPVWIGEFGEDNAERVQAMRREIDAQDLAGWAFWPWKKVPDGRYPGLGEIEAPANWTILAEDLTAGGGAPGRLSWAEAEQALDRMLVAAEPGALQLNAQLQTALLAP